MLRGAGQQHCPLVGLELPDPPPVCAVLVDDSYLFIIMIFDMKNTHRYQLLEIEQ
jgi:hypothetical protein